MCVESYIDGCIPGEHFIWGFPPSVYYEDCYWSTTITQYPATLSDIWNLGVTTDMKILLASVIIGAGCLYLIWRSFNASK